MKIGREFYFEAAHHLPNYKGKCEQVHGHTYKLEVVIEGEKGKDGMVMDFGELGEVVEKEVIGVLDHQELNLLLPNPTAENIVEWVWKKLESKLPLYSLKLWEGRAKWVMKEREK